MKVVCLGLESVLLPKFLGGFLVSSFTLLDPRSSADDRFKTCKAARTRVPASSLPAKTIEKIVERCGKLSGAPDARGGEGGAGLCQGNVTFRCLELHAPRHPGPPIPDVVGSEEEECVAFPMN